MIYLQRYLYFFNNLRLLRLAIVPQSPRVVFHRITMYDRPAESLKYKTCYRHRCTPFIQYYSVTLPPRDERDTYAAASTWYSTRTQLYTIININAIHVASYVCVGIEYNIKGLRAGCVLEMTVGRLRPNKALFNIVRLLEKHLPTFK